MRPHAEGERSTALARAWRSLREGTRRLVARYRRARLSNLAAALSYYAAFSLAPLLLLLGGWLAATLRAREDLARAYRSALAQLLAPILPEGLDTQALIERSFDLVIAELSAGATLRTVVSIVVLLWAASGFFASLQRALEVIFEVPQERGFFRTRAVALLLIAAVAAVIALELLGGTLAAWVWRTLQAVSATLEPYGLALGGPPGVVAGPGVLRFVLGLAAFTAAFRWLPRTAARWRGAAVGALVSVVGIQVMRLLLPLALDEARFNLVYGVVTSLVVLLLWLYLALLLFLLGALVAAEASAEIVRREAQRSVGASALPRRG